MQYYYQFHNLKPNQCTQDKIQDWTIIYPLSTNHVAHTHKNFNSSLIFACPVLNSCSKSNSKKKKNSQTIQLYSQDQESHTYLNPNNPGIRRLRIQLEIIDGGVEAVGRQGRRKRDRERVRLVYPETGSRVTPTSIHVHG